ncbi:MAG: nucleotide-binding protein [Alphaproteobacteria bacterium]|nr:nucleotide-binding protein [Alphaproteobacteria bacterium]
MSRAVERFRTLIKRLEQFEPEEINDREEAAISDLEAAIRTAVEKTYPAGSTQYNQLTQAFMLDRAGYNIGNETSIHEVREGLKDGKRVALTSLKNAIDDLEDDLKHYEKGLPGRSPTISSANKDNKKVFIVHGHDEAARHELARFIEKASLQPIILHEQASGGRTIIEKIEEYSDVGFAVVLLTPDDVGRSRDADELQPRARQNVVAELFYFLGKLGRSRVCALKKNGIEIPSDIGGVIYIDMDHAGAWKTTLLREFEGAGYMIDWGNALR